MMISIGVNPRKNSDLMQRDGCFKCTIAAVSVKYEAQAGPWGQTRLMNISGSAIQLYAIK